MSKLPDPRPTEFLLYETDDGHSRIDVRTDGDTVWLNLMQMVELFGRDKSVVSRHIKNVFDEGELDRTATVASHATVQIEGTREIRRHIEFYNLDVIISVGYRIKSSRGTQFRIWATQRLRDYLLKDIIELNRVVTMWLDFAEDQALRRKEIYLHNWSDKLDAFLRVNDRPVLSGMGTVSHRQAEAHAEGEYEQFAEARRATLEFEGEADLVRLLQPLSADQMSVTERGMVEQRLSAREKDKGADDAA